MARKSTKSLVEQCEKVTVRLPSEVARKIAKQCEENGIAPSVYMRFAARVFVEFRTLDVVGKLQSVQDEQRMMRDEQVRMRIAFNEAVEAGSE